MNVKKIVVLFLFLSLYSTTSAFAQWKLLGNIPLGGFQSVASSPFVDSNHNLYICSPSTIPQEQLYKREFSSNRWTVLQVDSAHPASQIIASICLPNGTLVAVCATGSSQSDTGGGMFWTTDAGLHWTKEWTFPDLIVNSLALSPQGILLAGTGSGLYLTDATDTLWSKTGEGLFSADVSVFAAPNGHYFAFSDSLYRSIDGGTTWVELDSALFGTSTYSNAKFGVSALTANSQGVLLAAARGLEGTGAIFHSSDDGQTWSITTVLRHGTSVTNFSKTPDGNIYATGFGRSTDDGVNWQSVPNLWGNGYVLSVAPGLLAAMASRLFESSDDGEHWFPVDSGFSISNILDLAYKNKTLYASLATYGIIRSTDDGTTWHTINDSLVSDTYSFFSEGSDLYAEGATTIFQWNGNVWNPLPQLGDQSAISVCADTSGQLFAGDSYSGLWSLQKNADTWVPMGNLALQVISIACDSSNVLYAFMDSLDGLNTIPSSLAFYTSKDGGNTWNMFHFLGLDTVSQSAFPTLVMAANKDTLCISTTSTLYRSRDHGATWTAQPFGQELYPIGLAFHNGLTFVYNNNTVWETENDTSAWQMDTGYTGAWLTSMTIAENNIAYLGAATSGIYSRSLPGVSSSGVTHHVATSNVSPNFEVIQTPNHLTLLSDQPTLSLRLLNILGDDILSQRGSGTLEVNLGPLPSGTYYAIIESESGREVKRIVVVH